MSPRVGEVVGAQRWPQYGSHPSNWGAPWPGLLLDPRDPRAWANTCAFPTDAPCPKAVARWVDRIEREHGLTRVPVLWDFGDRKVAFWEMPDRVVHYMDDMDRWLNERNAAMRREEELRASATRECAALAA